MKNPVNSRAYSGAGVITPENPLNSPGISNGQGYNTFDLSNQQYSTPRFADITPFSVLPVEPGDRINLKSSHELRAPTFKSPLMSELRLNKDYFFVPKSAMMPNTYEYLLVNPNRGDDVPDDAFPVFDIRNFMASMNSLFSRIAGSSGDSSHLERIANGSLLFGWWLNIAFHAFSYGSVLDYLGYRQHLYRHYKFNQFNQEVDDVSFGICFNNFIDMLLKTKDTSSPIKIGLYGITVNTQDPLEDVEINDTAEFFVDISKCTREDLRAFFYRAFYYSEPWVMKFVTNLDSSKPASYIPGNILTEPFEPLMLYYDMYGHSGSSDFIKPYNLYRLIAYHMACVQFFSNDTVDDVFTAKLWLQNMESLERLSTFGRAQGADVGLPTSPTYFDRNGIEIRYDVFSKHNLDFMINLIADQNIDLVIQNGIKSENWFSFSFFFNLFEFHFALRYGDYFAGARPKPLAVGDVNISINSQMVSAVDVTKGITMQRFLNAINRVGQLLPDYMRNIFGVTPKYLPPQPRFVNHESEVISGQTVVNTAENQGNQMLNLVSHSSKFAYDVFIDEPGYLLGLASFTCLPAYVQDTPRDIYHYDRLDDFQPFLQNIGDQEVYLQELIGLSDFFGTEELFIDGKPFAYQLQDAEYKYGVSSLHGGFIRNLPSWAFVQKDNTLHISPEFLRLAPYQFDRFFTSLTGVSLDDYFHFIVSFNNKITANRRMMYRPGIL